MTRAAAAETLVFELPLPPNIANARMHWAVKNKKRQRYFEDCDVALYEKMGRLYFGIRGWQKAQVTVTLRLSRTMDTDNLMARCKWPMDYLVDRGYILDDSPAHLEWSGLPTQLIDRKRQGITIALERL